MGIFFCFFSQKTIENSHVPKQQLYVYVANESTLTLTTPNYGILLRNNYAHMSLYVIQLFQLTLLKTLRDKASRRYRKLKKKQPNEQTNKLSYGLPLKTINHTGRCLLYLHPSHGSDNHEIIAESQKTDSCPYYYLDLSK